MRIQVKTARGLYYLMGKEKGKQPSITPFRGKAWDFKDLNHCKVIRDDVMDYFTKVMITS